MNHKRAIIITNDEQIIFRHDVKINGIDFIEYDLFNALTRLDNDKHINLKKIFNMLKVKYGMSVTDTMDLITEIATNKDNWQIIPNGVKNE